MEKNGENKMVLDQAMRRFLTGVKQNSSLNASCCILSLIHFLSIVRITVLQKSQMNVNAFFYKLIIH